MNLKKQFRKYFNLVKTEYGGRDGENLCRQEAIVV
jgi:hypothetical protein